MSNLLTIFIYFGIVFSVLSNLFLLAFPLAIWFSLRADAIWLIPFGFLVDGYFGAFYHIPYLTITACVWYFFAQILKPKLFWRNSYE